MRKVIDFILLKKEAYLFDAILYIMKSFVAVLTAYAIIRNLPLVQKDMISVLFGLMMTLEPVTVTGIRSGLRQITATILGALATAIIVAVFGINIWTVAFSVSATLFLCLKINWREVSPVAIFTSIYMTQFVQYTVSGEPSVLRTFQLRILALGMGVLIAVLFNFLFSLFFYKKMERKRVAHILETITGHMKKVKKGVDEGLLDVIYHEKESLPAIFTEIDWLYSLVKDKEKEADLKKKLHLKDHYIEIVSFENVLVALRNIAHLVYDTTYVLTYQLPELSMTDRQSISAELYKLIKNCDYLASHYEKSFIKYTMQGQPDQEIDLRDNRFLENLKGIHEMLNRINELG